MPGRATTPRRPAGPRPRQKNARRKNQKRRRNNSNRNRNRNRNRNKKAYLAVACSRNAGLPAINSARVLSDLIARTNILAVFM